MEMTMMNGGRDGSSGVRRLIAFIIGIAVALGIMGFLVFRGMDDANAPSHPLITVAHPLPGEVVSSPLLITGEARGYWFFEGSFPVELRDGTGVVIAEGPAQAKVEWMTEDFVPFEITLHFSKPATKEGVLVLRKDNPSGLPEHDDLIAIPVIF